MVKLTKKNKEVLEELEKLLSELDKVDTSFRELDARKDKAITAVTEKYAPQIDPLVRRRDEIMDRVSELWVENQDALIEGGGKQLELRSATISSRTSPPTVEVEKDAEGRAIDYLRKMHRLLEFTRQPKRVLNKSALKREPKFAARIPGVSIIRTEKLTVKLNRTQAQLEKEIHPFRRQIG